MSGVETKAEASGSSTWSHLLSFGFADDSTKSGWTPKLYYDFGSFILEASLSLNRYFREMVIFGGSYSNTREMGIVEFELPSNLVSAEQTAAMLFYYLRSHERPWEPNWLLLGKNNQHLLPWLDKK